ncbi:DUF883 family protein [Rubrimonas cliftonensis]|uniref:Membrane-anchored ribosome-binding protein, inhibits growth in stationary phase, ElaB/YqjD/DUF883 family n=1 Tax=Rubrimonas cliftonensis TaxID=89524 RepID=A0A1H4CG65_9RHOB|nr:DUF883 family protein [Rubrimonas cliftonensis]SEA59425.1 Membrane-anchored ribosome-binding protein, inhibits growth in stationary phase, ElaB/YqjD/DUF883 family [Rubrimonas cliftonensis]
MDMQKSRAASAEADLGTLSREVDGLRRDVAAILSRLTAGAGESAGKLGADLGGVADEATRLADRKGRETRVAVERTIRDNPLTALGVAAGVGLLVGLISRR